MVKSTASSEMLGTCLKIAADSMRDERYFMCLVSHGKKRRSF